MSVSTVEETITVSSEAPVVDTTKTGSTTHLHPRSARRDSDLARPVGDDGTDPVDRHGPRQRRRFAVGPAVGLRRPRRRHHQQRVVARRRQRDRHVRHRRDDDVLQLRLVRADAVQHRRQRRDDRHRRHGHQPRDEERIGQVPRQQPVSHHRQQAAGRQRDRRTARAGRVGRQPDSAQPRLRHRRRRSDRARAVCGSGARRRAPTSGSASTTSSRAPRDARRPPRRRARSTRKRCVAV